MDEKPYYLFGRNVDVVDVVAEHASCSREHAALIFHKDLKDRAFLMDLGSAHGTFIGQLRLDSSVAKPLQFRQVFHLGASTRTYAVKTRADYEQQHAAAAALGGGESTSDNKIVKLPTLLYSDAEFEAMTHYNTNQNVQLMKLRGDDAEQWSTRKQRQHQGILHATMPRKSAVKRPVSVLVDEDNKLEEGVAAVSFKDQDEIINPEDIDPTIGKFRDMVRVQIISGPTYSSEAAKRRRLMPSDTNIINTSDRSKISRSSPFFMPSKQLLTSAGTVRSKNDASLTHSALYSDLASSSLLPIPNLAPELGKETAAAAPFVFGYNSMQQKVRRNSESDSSDTVMLDATDIDGTYKGRWEAAPVFTLNTDKSRQRRDSADDNAFVQTSRASTGSYLNMEVIDAEHDDIRRAKLNNNLQQRTSTVTSNDAALDKKKTYVKEVWPGKAPDPMPQDVVVDEFESARMQ